MRLAIIDLGTNSVRFDVYQFSGHRVQRLHREKAMIRLGQGVFIDGKLDSNAIQKTLRAFQLFKKTAAALHVEKFVAFGTSALRESSDGERLVERINVQTGIPVRVISGTEEARLIALGILNNENLGSKKVGLVDIGGGSTEISICHNDRVLFLASFPLGTARLQQIFLKRSPPKPENIDQLRRYIRSNILQKTLEEEWPKVETVIGSSGTVRAVSNIIKKYFDSKTVSHKLLRSLNNDMCKMTTTQLLGVPGMESDRVDMILAGSIVLEEVLFCLHAKHVLPTTFSLRDGIIFDQIQKFKQNTNNNFQIQDLAEKAKRFGIDGNHVDRRIHLAEKMFKVLQRVHKLKSSWQKYFVGASILRDVGKAVTPIHYGRHSNYIVQESLFPGMDPWEAEFIGLLCQYCENEKIKKLPLKPERKAAFLKILSMLKIVDALDSSRSIRIEIVKAKLSRTKVEIFYRARPATDYELLRIEQRKSTFESVFSKTLVAQRIS